VETKGGTLPAPLRESFALSMVLATVVVGAGAEVSRTFSRFTSVRSSLGARTSSAFVGFNTAGNAGSGSVIFSAGGVSGSAKVKGVGRISGSVL
jgi:hypothetical protein